ncbi:hypothetical protein Vafri_14033 [Volvox africanus]|nr:hypothetical protein Vafri_14033 [Volvox africanus]
MQKRRHGIINLYTAVLSVHLAVCAAAQFQAPVSCPKVTGFNFLRLHGSLERNLGRVARPENTTSNGWISYLAFICQGLGTCTGFSTLGWLKAEVGAFGTGGQWYALSSWDLMEDPGGECAGFYVRTDMPRRGCPQASGYFLYENTDVSGGELKLPNRANLPSYEPPTTNIVAQYGAECDTYPTCTAFTSFGVLLGSLQRYKNLADMPLALSELYGECSGLYVRIPQPMTILGGFRSLVKTNSSIELPIFNNASSRPLQSDFKIPADWNSDFNYIELSFEGTYLPMDNYGRDVGFLQLAQQKRDNTNTVPLWLGGPDGSRVARVTWYLTNVELSGAELARIRIQTLSSGWSALRFYVALTWRANFPLQLPVIPSPPASNTPPPQLTGPPSAPLPPELPYSTMSSTTGNYGIMLSPTNGERNTTLIRLKLPSEWSVVGSRIVIRFMGTYIPTPNASRGRSPGPGFGPMGQFVVTEARRVPVTLTPTHLNPRPPPPPPFPPNSPGLPPSPPPSPPIPPGSILHRPFLPAWPQSPPEAPELPGPPSLDLPPMGFMRRLQQAPSDAGPPPLDPLQSYRINETSYTLPIESAGDGSDRTLGISLYLINLPFKAGSQVTLGIRTVDGGWNGLKASMSVEWQQPSRVVVMLPDMPSTPRLPAPPPPRPPAPTRPPAPPRPPSPPPGPPQPPSLPDFPPLLPSPPRPPPAPSSNLQPPLQPPADPIPDVGMLPPGISSSPNNGLYPGPLPTNLHPADGPRSNKALVIGVPVAVSGAGLCMLVSVIIFVIVARTRPRLSRLSQLYLRPKTSDFPAQSAGAQGSDGGARDGSTQGGVGLALLAQTQRSGEAGGDMSIGSSLSLGADLVGGSPRNHSQKVVPPPPQLPITAESPRPPNRLAPLALSPKGTFLRGTWQGDLLPLMSFFPAVPAQAPSSFNVRTLSPRGLAAATGRATRGSESIDAYSPTSILPLTKSRSSPGNLWEPESQDIQGLQLSSPFGKIAACRSDANTGTAGSHGLPVAISYREAEFAKDCASGAHAQEAGWGSLPTVLPEAEPWRSRLTQTTNGAACADNAVACGNAGLHQQDLKAKPHRARLNRSCFGTEVPKRQTPPRLPVLTQTNLSVQISQVSSVSAAKVFPVPADIDRTCSVTASMDLLPAAPAAENLAPALASSTLSLAPNDLAGSFLGVGDSISSVATASRGRCRRSSAGGDNHRGQGVRTAQRVAKAGTYASPNSRPAVLASGCLSGNDSGQQPDIESNGEDSSDVPYESPTDGSGGVAGNGALAGASRRPTASDLPRPYSQIELRDLSGSLQSPVRHHTRNRRSSWCGYVPTSRLAPRGASVELGLELQPKRGIVLPPIDLSTMEGVYRLIRAGAAALPRSLSSAGDAVAELPSRLSRTLSDPYMFTAAGQVVAVAAAAAAAAAVAAAAAAPKRRSRGGAGRVSIRHSQELDPALLETPFRSRLPPVPWSTPPVRRRLVGAIPGFQFVSAEEAAAATAGGPYAHAFSAAAVAAATGAGSHPPHDYPLGRSRSCLLVGADSRIMKGSAEEALLQGLPSAHVLLPPHPHRGRRRYSSAPMLPMMPRVPYNSPEDDQGLFGGTKQRANWHAKYGMPKRTSLEEPVPLSHSHDPDPSGCAELLRSAALRLEAQGNPTDMVASVTQAAIPAAAASGADKTPANLSISQAIPVAPPPSQSSPRSAPSLDDGGPFAAVAMFVATYSSGPGAAAPSASQQVASPPPSVRSGSANASPSTGAAERALAQPLRSPPPPTPLAISTPSLPYRRPRYATELQTILSGGMDDSGCGPDSERWMPQQLQASRQQDRSLERPPMLMVSGSEAESMRTKSSGDEPATATAAAAVVATATTATYNVSRQSSAAEPQLSVGVRNARASVNAGGVPPSAASAAALIGRLTGTTSTTMSSSGSATSTISGSASGKSLPPSGIDNSHGGSEPLPPHSPSSVVARSKSYNSQTYAAAMRMGSQVLLGRANNSTGPVRNTASQLHRVSGPFGAAAAAVAADSGVIMESPSARGASSIPSVLSSRPGSASASPTFQLHRRPQPTRLLVRAASNAGSSALRRQQASGQGQLSIQSHAAPASPIGAEPLEKSSSHQGVPTSPTAPCMAAHSSAIGFPLNGSPILSSAVATAVASDQSGTEQHTSWMASTLCSATATSASMQSVGGSLLANQTLDVPCGQASENQQQQPQNHQQQKQQQKQQQQGIGPQVVARSMRSWAPSALMTALGVQDRSTSLTEERQPPSPHQQQRQVPPRAFPPPLVLPNEDSHTQRGTNSTLGSMGQDSGTPSGRWRNPSGTSQATESPNSRSKRKVVPDLTATRGLTEHVASDAGGNAAASPFNDNTAAAVAWAAAAAIAMGMDGVGASKDGSESGNAGKLDSETLGGSAGAVVPIRSRNKCLRTPTQSPRQIRSPRPQSPQQPPMWSPSRPRGSDPDQQLHAQPQASPQEQMLLVPARSVDMDLDPNEIHVFRDGLLGQGAFGAVYRGVYRRDMVAVKLLNGSIVDGRALQRDMASFHAELSILSRLRHKNIVRLYGGCMRPPCIFLVMQLMRQSLDSVIHHAQQPLTLRKALQIARDVAAGLSYLHPTIVHRDLKPANILIDEHGTAKLSDFGLARYKFKAYLSTRTPDQGSVAYMAPECFNTDIGGLGPKTDIYSFGVLLWELLSGEYPWMGESNVQIIYK